MNKTAWNKETVDGEKRKKKNKNPGIVQLHRGTSRGGIFLNVLQYTVQNRSIRRIKLCTKTVYLTKNFVRSVSRQDQFASQVIWTLLGQMMELIGGEKEFCPHCCFGSAIVKPSRLSYHKFIYTAESIFLLV